MAATAGLYRRALPSPPAIEFSCAEGKELFNEALQQGTMEGFFRLISYFQTQSEPSYCGLASLAMVLNVLAIDPGRKWKGPWRWFDESMLDCCEPLEKVKKKGVTFGQVACLALCAGAKVEAFRTNELSIDDFRRHVVQCASSEDIYLIASYHRKPFQQTGTGHFSPIGGYHAGRDMVLILDVARFKYPPHWAPLSLLWEAMDTIDEATGRPRGLMLISKMLKVPSVLCKLSCRDDNWISIAKYLIEDIPCLLESENPKSISEFVSLVLKTLPTNARDLIKWGAEVGSEEEKFMHLSSEDKGRLADKDQVWQHVRETELFWCIKERSSSAVFYPESENVTSDNGFLVVSAANSSHQGTQILGGNLGTKDELLCGSMCVNCSKPNDGLPGEVISGTVMSGESKQWIDMPLPLSTAKSCFSKKILPVSNEVLTIFLLALPPATWLGIKQMRLLEDVQNALSIENLPDILREEVLYLRRQLQFLMKCKDNKVDDDICSLLP